MLLITTSHILRPLTRFGVETCSFASCLLGLLDCATMGLLKDLLIEVFVFPLCNEIFIHVIPMK